MREVVIASAVRTPIGKFGGTLSTISAVELGEIVIREVLARAKIRPDKVDEVIMGNVLQSRLGQNPAGQAAVRAEISRYSPSFTVGKVCGAGMKAVIISAQAIKAGDADIILTPDLNSGNILYKSLIFLAGSTSAAIVMGADSPVVLTSRADSEASKLMSLVLAAALN